MKLIVFVGMAALLFSGCNALKDMGDMKDTTAHMDQTTTHMDQITTDMSGKTTDMDSKMTDLSAKTDHMAAVTEDLAKKTAEMEEKTDHMAEVTDKMAKTTDHMSETTDSMAKTTQGMAVVTQHMSTTTDHMAQTTDQMRDMTQDMTGMMKNSNQMQKYIYSDNRQSAAMQDRAIAEKAMDKMITSETMLDKFSWAGKYFDAFEFQIWKDAPVVGDTEEKREMMEADAVQEFFNEINGQIRNYNRFSPITPMPKTENAYRDLMALAGAMDQLNTNQVLAGEENHFPPISLERILENSYGLMPAINEGKLNPIPPQVQQVVAFEPQVRYMINLRHNVIFGCTLSQIAGVDMDNLLNVPQIKNLFVEGTKLTTRQPIDVTNLNVGRMDQIISYLEEVKRVRAKMLDLGIQVERSLLSREGANLIRVAVKPSEFGPNVAQDEKDTKAARAKTMNDDLEALSRLATPNEVIYNDSVKN